MTDLRQLLTQIRAEAGALTPCAVVDAARAKNHPLHGRFEWNDKVAGESYRRVQAGELIRSVKFRYADEPEPLEVNAFQAIRGQDGDQDYQPVDEVVANPFSRELLLRQMRRDWAAFERRYKHLAEFVELVAATAKAS